MTFFRKTWHFLALLVLFFACRKTTTANWDVDVVLPVVNSSLNIRNFVDDSSFTADNNNLLHFVMNREVGAIMLDSLLQIPDTTVEKAFVNEFFLPVPLKPGDAIPLTPSDLSFDFGNGIQLKRADVRQGTIFVKFSNDISQPMDLVYSLPGVKKNGQAFEIRETIPSGINSLSKSYSLDGYSMNLQGGSGNKFNTLAQTYSLSLNPNSSSVEVQPNQGAAVEVSFTGIIPEFVLGYFGQQTVDLGADTANLDLGKNFTASGFMLSEATMDFTIENEFGVDFSGSINNVKGINSQNNSEVTLSGDQLESININRATRVGSEISSSKKLINFNTNNSNITSFISNLPDIITYGGSVKMNPVPPGNISGYNDFAFYNTGLRIFAKIDIPLKFNANYFELRSDAIMDVSTVSQLDNINSGQFVVHAENGFPFSARVQGYMYDAQNQLLDSVLISGANTIAGGQVDAQNVVVAPTKTTLFIPVDRAKIDNLKKTTVIKVVTRFIMSPNPPAITLLDHYELIIRIVAEVNYNVGLNGN